MKNRSVEEAIRGPDGQLNEEDIEEAADYLFEEEEVPGTDGELMTRREYDRLHDQWCRENEDSDLCAGPDFEPTDNASQSR